MLALAKPVGNVPVGSLATLRRKAADCRACPLWRGATQVVFGKGPTRAEVMLIGEQPGAQEDLSGEPFAGPAGQLLDRAMDEAQLDREKLYLTNTVKHFKYAMRGKAKLHKRANAAEQTACRSWLAAELLRVHPRWVVGLGAMAAQTLFGSAFRLTARHGEWRDMGDGVQALATWHPASVLRMPQRGRRHAVYGELVADLRKVAVALAESAEDMTDRPS